jgi:hypothetical protein
MGTRYKYEQVDNFISCKKVLTLKLNLRNISMAVEVWTHRSAAQKV